MSRLLFLFLLLVDVTPAQTIQAAFTIKTVGQQQTLTKGFIYVDLNANAMITEVVYPEHIVSGCIEGKYYQLINDKLRPASGLTLQAKESILGQALTSTLPDFLMPDNPAFTLLKSHRENGVITNRYQAIQANQNVHQIIVQSTDSTLIGSATLSPNNQVVAQLLINKSERFEDLLFPTEIEEITILSDTTIKKTFFQQFQRTPNATILHFMERYKKGKE